MFYNILTQSLDKVAVALVVILFFLLDYRTQWWKRDTGQVADRVPGPLSIPIFGTRWFLYFNGFRLSNIHEFYELMYKKYGSIFKEEAFFNIPVYSIFERSDIEKVLKVPSKFPIRPPTEAEVAYRYSRPDRYASAGLVNEQGEKWLHLRTSLTADLTSPKTISHFRIEASNLAEDWCNYVKSRKQNDGYVNNLIMLVVDLCIETTCALVLGRRLGFLSPDKVSEKSVKLAEALQGHFIGLRDTQFCSVPLWKYFQTKSYKMLVDCENHVYETLLDIINDFGEENHEGSLYNSIINANTDEREKKAALIDFIAAGIHTLKNSLVFMLYLVAKHPNIQDKIIKDFDFAKACMTESFRLLPTATPLARILEQDMELSGYHLRAGSVVLCHNGIANVNDHNFERAKEFRPERWLGEEKQKTIKTSLFLVTPFGIGRRICPGKRFIELVLPIFLQETVRNFEMTTDYELELQFEFLRAPKGPVSVVFKDRY